MTDPLVSPRVLIFDGKEIGTITVVAGGYHGETMTGVVPQTHCWETREAVTACLLQAAIERGEVE